MNVIDRAGKAKIFVSNHRTELALAAGCAIGVFTTILVLQKNPFVTCFMVSAPTMKKLETRDGAVVFNPYHGREYALIKSPF